MLLTLLFRTRGSPSAASSSKSAGPGPLHTVLKFVPGTWRRCTAHEASELSGDSQAESRHPIRLREGWTGRVAVSCVGDALLMPLKWQATGGLRRGLRGRAAEKGGPRARASSRESSLNVQSRRCSSSFWRSYERLPRREDRGSGRCILRSRFWNCPTLLCLQVGEEPRKVQDFLI